MREVRQDLRLRLRSPRRRWNLTLIASFLAGVACFPLWLLTGTDGWFRTFGCLCTWSLLSAVYTYFHRSFVAPYQFFKRLVELGEFVCLIDDAGIREVTHNAEVFRGWDSVTKFSEDRHGIAIHFAGGAAMVIPKRCLKDEELDELRDQLSRVSRRC
jgi:YcxB-like protein